MQECVFWIIQDLLRKKQTNSHLILIRKKTKQNSLPRAMVLWSLQCTLCLGRHIFLYQCLFNFSKQLAKSSSLYFLFYYYCQLLCYILFIYIDGFSTGYPPSPASFFQLWKNKWQWIKSRLQWMLKDLDDAMSY